MTTLEEAYNIITTTLIPTEYRMVSLKESLGKVLGEDLYADRNFPPFDRVTMDGIAISHRSFKEGQRDFLILGMAPAGSPQVVLEDPSGCIEVMTGAVLPEGTDTVIRYEDLEIKDKVVSIQVAGVKFQQNVHATGNDRTTGDLLVKAGKVIGPAEIGIAATVGKAEVRVVRTPRTLVISTGDELVEVDQLPEAHQIRRSNVHTIVSALAKRGVVADDLHLVDDRAALVNKLGLVLENHEVLILSGGVSKGKFDYVPEVLKELGIKKLFHGVRQRPGKPFWFGTNGKNVVFALPGNPVSSYMCTTRYIQDWFDKVMGLPQKQVPFAILNNDFTFKPDLTYLLQVKVSYNDLGQILATPIEGGGSGDLANLGKVDAFLELPRGREVFEKGEIFKVYFF